MPVFVNSKKRDKKTKSTTSISNIPTETILSPVDSESKLSLIDSINENDEKISELNDKLREKFTIIQRIVDNLSVELPKPVEKKSIVTKKEFLKKGTGTIKR